MRKIFKQYQVMTSHMELRTTIVCLVANCILLDLSGYSVIGNGFPGVSASIDKKCHQQLASSFGSVMAIKVGHFSGFPIMQNIYEERAGREEFSVHHRDGLRLTQRMADDLGKMLKKKKDAVMKTVMVLEEESERFIYNSTSEPSYYNVEFLNKKKEELEDRIIHEYDKQIKTLDLTKDSRFLDRRISLNQSVVQVPFDVYSRGPEVLKGVQWSKVLSERFAENLRNDPTMKWQYFGSTEGFVRMYPGFQWKMEEKYGHPNIYDCRNRNWYVEAATYPKNMLILVDGSGSMKGLKSSIAAHVVDTLLLTLGDNDFFNVVTYNNEVHFVEPCFSETLVRADSTNKNRVKEALLHSNTTDVADLSNALNVSFNVMLEFHASGSGSDCYSSIMIITDGSTNSYQGVMDRYKNATMRQIRIFSYLIGADKAYLQPVRDIACNNYGYFQQVESRNDVSEKVLHYLTVMNRPQAFQEDHHTIWTKPYYDTTYLDLGFGLITTVSTPVYLHRSWKKPLMLGVAATDVPISLFLDSINLHKTGVNSYIFIITNHGYVVAHPRLNTTYRTLYGEEMIKPNYNSMDIDNVEWNNANETLRHALLAREKGITPAKNVIFPLEDWTRAMTINGKYFYAPIAETPFSIGMFQPNDYGGLKLVYSHTLKIKRSGPTYSEEECDKVNKNLMESSEPIESPNRVSAICSLNFSDIQVSEKWQYCTTKNNSVMMNTFGMRMSQFNVIRTYFFGKNDNLVCDADLLNGVLFDVYVTAPLHPIWVEYSKFRNTSSEGIEMAFITTQSGVTRQFWFEDAGPSYDVVQDKLKGFERQNFPAFYRQTATYTEKDVWVYSILSGGTDWEPFYSIMITQAVRQDNAVLGVMGLVMKASYFAKFFEETNDSAGVGCTRGMDSVYNCYVIDDNGIVLYSSNDSVEDIGRTIGEVDGQLTRHLLSTNVLSTTELYDYGTMCMDELNVEDVGGSAISSFIFHPLNSAFSYASWWANDFALVLAKLVVWNLWSMIFNSGTSDATFSTFKDEDVHYRVCDVKYKLLKVNYESVPVSAISECDANCTREIGIERINQSNMFLIVTQNPNAMDCECTNQTMPYTTSREEITYVGDDKCARLRDHKLRRQVNSCQSHGDHTLEMEEQSSLPCESNSATSMFRSRGWVKVRKANKNSHGSSSYVMLCISWFAPYLLFNILNLSEYTIANLSPFA